MATTGLSSSAQAAAAAAASARPATERLTATSYGGAVADLCLDSSGNSSKTSLTEVYADANLTPISSLRLRMP